MNVPNSYYDLFPLQTVDTSMSEGMLKSSDHSEASSDNDNGLSPNDVNSKCRVGNYNGTVVLIKKIRMTNLALSSHDHVELKMVSYH